MLFIFKNLISRSVLSGMAKSRDPDLDTWIQPRDILTPAATLLGLVVAAIGLSSTIAGVSSIMRALSLVLILVVLLFASAAMATCVSTLRRSYRLFRVGVVLFAMGWAFTALVVSIFLIGYAWGVDVLLITIPIPQIPRLDIATLISTTFSIISAIVAFWSYRKNRIDKLQLTNLASKLPPRAAKRSQALIDHTLEQELDDPKMALVKLAIDIERDLRSKVKSVGYAHGPFAPLQEVTDFLLYKNAIGATTAASIKRIWAIRNTIIHSGGDVSSSDARVALNLAANVLSTLSTDARDLKR